MSDYMNDDQLANFLKEQTLSEQYAHVDEDPQDPQEWDRRHPKIMMVVDEQLLGIVRGDGRCSVWAMLLGLTSLNRTTDSFVRGFIELIPAEKRCEPQTIEHVFALIQLVAEKMYKLFEWQCTKCTFANTPDTHVLCARCLTITTHKNVTFVDQIHQTEKKFVQSI